MLAGLAADGETMVIDRRHVDRGYADLAGKLRALGADVT
jgi:UDP-N-acetylglucosamine 1-carboxyvinyltransferase